MKTCLMSFGWVWIWSSILVVGVGGLCSTLVSRPKFSKVKFYICCFLLIIQYATYIEVSFLLKSLQRALPP